VRGGIGSLGVWLALAACSAPGIDRGLDPSSLWIPAPAAAAPDLPDGVRVRALTLNLHGGQEATAERVAAALAELSLDVIGLQESPPSYPPVIAARTGLTHQAGAEGVVLLSRTPLTESATVGLVAGRGFVHAQTVIDGEPFSLYVAHIGWNAEGDRQARELVDRYLRPDAEPRVLMIGDFNDEHLSTQATILEEVVEDAFTALGWYPGQRISWPSTGFDGSEGSQLIDLHYYRRSFAPIVLSGDVLNVSPVLSDHKPSLVELLYPRGDRPFAADPFPGRRQPWLAAMEAGPNLLIDPGAERGGEGWEPENGGEISGERENQAPRSGGLQFTGASDGWDREDLVSGWRQRIDLAEHAAAIDAGQRWLAISGYGATGYRIDDDGGVRANAVRPYDEGEVVLDLDDGAGQVIQRWTSGRRDTLKMQPFGATIPVVPGARGATVRLLSHLKLQSGRSHDAVFDDLSAALIEAPHPVRGPGLIAGAEDPAESLGDLTRLADGAAIELMLYPPRTRALRGMWMAGPAPAAGGRIAAIEERLHDAVDRGELSLRFGGWARTMNAIGGALLAVELYDEDGDAPAIQLALPELQAAEWTELAAEIRLPPGTRRIGLRAEAAPASDLVFFDELWALIATAPP
jgi:endonuclease/exonuclease/phosphatase family metal-dependent hydrolase